MVLEIWPKPIMTPNQKFLGEPPASYSWGRFVIIFMSWNVKDFLGEYFWGQCLEIFISWDIKDILGEISGEKFSKNLRREILSIFWERFLGKFQQIFML